MRRGLMAWNEAEISLAALDARAERLRAAMREDGLDGFLIYTNFPRPSAVAWLTSFTPYWSEAILYVPAAGEIVFATAIKNLGGPWSRSVKKN
jgi:Xaa-Pro aminopeptidase